MVYIPIIRIPIKGWMTIPNTRSLDPGSHTNNKHRNSSSSPYISGMFVSESVSFIYVHIRGSLVGIQSVLWPQSHRCQVPSRVEDGTSPFCLGRFASIFWQRLMATTPGVHPGPLMGVYIFILEWLKLALKILKSQRVIYLYLFPGISLTWPMAKL